MSMQINIFEPKDELLELEKARQLALDEQRKIEQKEAELFALLNDLREKKKNVANEAQNIRFKIQSLERDRKIEAEKQLEIDALNKEANELEAYAKKLEELCSDFPSYLKLREYQKEDIVYSLKAFFEQKSGVLNGNDMSMGKTIEAVVTLYCIKKLHPDWKILWLTKKSLTISTPKEIMRWWPNVQIITSAIANTAQQRKFVLDMIDLGADFLVANYEFVRVANAEAFKWNVVVVDEAHKLKGGANASGPTEIWTKVKELCVNTDFTIFLTGTPMPNKPEEMWSYLHIFDPVKFEKLSDFQTAFGLYRSYGRDFGGETRANKLLQQVLKGQMFRRTTEEVGLQMPPIIKEVIELEMLPRQRKAYDMMRDKFYIWLDEQEDAALTSTSILAQLIRLRQINVWPNNIRFQNKDANGMISEQYLNIDEGSKIDEAMDIIDRVDKQLVVFSNFNEPLQEIKNRCKQVDIIAEVLNGDNTWDVERIESSFQNKKIQVLCMNSAVGEGLNLHKDPSKWEGGASFGIMLDKWYNDARNDQCVRRIVRPGSDDKGAFYYLENVDSIDTWINELCREKKEASDSITENETLRPNWKQHLKGKI